MSKLSQKRKRGIVLTSEGLEKLKKARFESEYQENFGERYTYEKISELTNLDLNTIKRVLACKEGVDKRTLERFFIAFNLELTTSCYIKPNPNKRQDWGEAMCVSNFYGRTFELTRLEQWLLRDRCRLITLLGMGGNGKTCLSVKLAQQVQDKFDLIVWRSLRDAPPLKKLLANIIQFFSSEAETEADLPESIGGRISRLIEYLRSDRCLLVLDNWESVLSTNNRAGVCREQYEGYGELLRRVGQTEHQSCLLLTTREKPKRVAALEGETLPVRTFRLSGLKKSEGWEILKEKGLDGSESEFNALVKHYGGNALALKIVATTIRDLFGGNVKEFLHSETVVFGDIRDLLDQQFKRLTSLEKDIIYWLAINREPTTLSELRNDLVASVPRANLMEGLESLSRRALLEQNASSFVLQSVVMEYINIRLIEQVCQEIETQKLNFFSCYALMKATAKDYVRERQIRLILQPVVDGLFSVFKCKRSIEERLTKILATQQETSPRERGYTAGNIINLFCQMETDLTGYDFSNLCVWQADLRNATLHNVNFQNADLAKSVFVETFGGVMSVVFSPDGKLLAAGDTNGEIRLRRVVDGQQIFTFEGHTNWITSLAFSPDSSILASGSSDHTVRLWDIETGQCFHTLQEHDNEVWSVDFSPDGSTLASGCDDHKIRLWSIRTGKCLKIFNGHINWVLSVAFSPDGKTLASGCDDNTIRLWNISTSECLKIFNGHSDGIRSITIRPDGQMLASGSDDNTIRLWNVNTGECLKTFNGHTNEVWSVTFRPDGQMLASGSNDNTIRLWDVSTGKCLKIFNGHTNLVFSIAFSPQGSILVSGGRDQTVRLWDVSTGQCLKIFNGYTNQVFSVSFSPDGQTLASGGRDQTVKLWNVSTSQCLKTFNEHNSAVRSVAFSPDGQTLASSSDDKTVRLWDLSTGQCLKTFNGHNAPVWSVAFSPDGQTLASSSDDKTIRLRNISTAQARICKGHEAAIWSVAFSPQGKILASGSLDQKVKLWDVGTGECKKSLEGHTSWIYAVAFSPDGQILASTSSDRTLRLWSVSTGECLRIIKEDTMMLQTVNFSSDGQTLAGGCCHKHTVKLWNTNTGEYKNTLQGHEGWLWSVAFSPDGRTLASSSDDETIRLWNVATGECLKIMRAKRPYEHMNLTDVTGSTKATIATLKVLGATDS
ncbi:pentapeptide repeat-containing protein [Pleurocapsales cyanobacterium LEGE 10410]|nr:pentapeptide repeat-containing protein [Pleurocapsales cyanobacterium LEGE 10410]